jgi:hypothetical protein
MRMKCKWDSSELNFTNRSTQYLCKSKDTNIQYSPHSFDRNNFFVDQVIIESIFITNKIREDSQCTSFK